MTDDVKLPLSGLSPALVAMVAGEHMPAVADLPAWQGLMVRVKKLTRFDEQSLTLLGHDLVWGRVAAEQRIGISLRAGRVQQARGLPAGVERVAGSAALDERLRDQLAACHAAVPDRLKAWRAGTDQVTATPGAALFLAGAPPGGFSFTCGTCNGRGQNSCGTCSGGGRVTCSRCNGGGTTMCYSCSGSGRKTCNSCGGSGRQFNNGNGPQANYQPCNSCGGGGQSSCWSCGGSRNITCQGCGGARQVNCSSCGGRGAIDCAPCAASGTQSVIGRISCDVAVADSLQFTCEDAALKALLDRFTSISAAAEHVAMRINGSRVEGQGIATQIGGTLMANRLRLQVGADVVELHAMAHSQAILDYRNIIGRLLQADIDALDAAAKLPMRPALSPPEPLLAALGATLESEAVSMVLRGKMMKDADGTLIGESFAKQVRSLVGRTLRRVHWQVAAPAILATLLLPFVVFDLMWRIPGPKDMGEFAAASFGIPLLIGLGTDWLLRRSLIGRMGPVARPALQRLLGQLGLATQARWAVGAAALAGAVGAYFL
jgi:hypothetical protein